MKKRQFAELFKTVIFWPYYFAIKYAELIGKDTTTTILMLIPSIFVVGFIIAIAISYYLIIFIPLAILGIPLVLFYNSLKD